MIHPRHLISPTLKGDVLEIGPGFRPFPVHEDARVRYADRRVGGRDATWPELIGIPSGPDPHFDVNIDKAGLAPIADCSFDVVIASHVIEHLANPLHALEEMQRVLRPGGRLVLIVPDRLHTFDVKREPTTFNHLWKEYEEKVDEVSEEHIREFCQAIWEYPPIHPLHVRAWYDPANVDVELHRRRSIHVHAWDPQQFSIMLVGALRMILNFSLDEFYTVDQIPEGDPMRNECGFVLRRQEDDQVVRHRRFIRTWLAIQHKHMDTIPAHLEKTGELRVDAFLGGLYRELGMSP